jgi:hypothetical protein
MNANEAECDITDLFDEVADWMTGGGLGCTLIETGKTR